MLDYDLIYIEIDGYIPANGNTFGAHWCSDPESFEDVTNIVFQTRYKGEPFLRTVLRLLTEVYWEHEVTIKYDYIDDGPTGRYDLYPFIFVKKRKEE